MNSPPAQEHGPHYGATSSFPAASTAEEPPSPVMDDPSEEFERELSNTRSGGSQ